MLYALMKRQHRRRQRNNNEEISNWRQAGKCNIILLE
jgi:hypothetical protein